MFRILFFVLILWLALVAFAWLFGSQRSEALFRTRLAKKRNGTLRRTLWGMGRSLVLFRHGIGIATVDLAQRRSEWMITLSTEWHAPSSLNFLVATDLSWFSLASDHPSSHRLELPGLGLPKIWSDNPCVASEALGARGSWELSQIVGLSNARLVFLRVSGDRWTLRGSLKAIDVATIDQWVQAGLQLHDQMRVQSQSEVKFYEDAPQLVQEARCGICGQDIQQAMVICARCKSPHHHDCWNYAGRCSTFGCGESSYCQVSGSLGQFGTQRK